MAEPRLVSSAPLRLAQLSHPNIAFGHVTAEEETTSRHMTKERGRRYEGKERGKYTPFVVPPAVETQSPLWKRPACPAW